MTRRAVILARQSLKKSPDSVSIPEQIAGMQRYCAEKGYAVVGIIESENVRGTRERDKRADLTEIETLADDGQFDVLIVWKLDRLARYLRVQENVIYELERHGVGFESATEPIVNSVMGRQVLGMMAEQFSRDLSQRLAGVVRAHVRMGKHMGKAPLGYCRGEDDRLRIDPGKAQIARALFVWRLEGMGSPAISTRLQADYGVSLAPVGVLRMLANPVYIGAVTAGDDVLVEGAHPAIVDLATFEAVQRTLNRNRAARAKRTASFLEGILTCGCGKPMYLTYKEKTWQDREYIYWSFRCRSTLGQMRHCPEPKASISQRKAEAAVLTQLQDAFRRVSTMTVDELVAQAEAQRTRQYPGWQRRQADLTAKLKKAKQRQDAINEARLDRRMSRDDANRRYRQLDAEIAEAERELAAGPRPVDPQAMAALHQISQSLVSGDLTVHAREHPDVLRAFLRQIGARVVVRDGVPMLEGMG